MEAPAATLVGCCVNASFAGAPTPPAVKFRWKLVVPPSPRKAEAMMKYVVPEVAANEICDCAIPVVALTLQATCVKLPGAPVTAVRMVSYGLVSVSAVMVPLLGATNLNHTLLASP